MRILYIGGSGQISFECIHESVRQGHEVAVFNRGNRNDELPPEVTFFKGDMFDDAAYFPLADENFDVVCQFRVYDAEAAARDVKLFSGHCGHYIFIGTASSYQKPLRDHPVTEDTPLVNPLASYSHKKIEAERVYQQQDVLTYTIVRPNLTYRLVMPLTALTRPLNISRLLRGKPVVVQGDGMSRCAVMNAADFAPPFVKLLGNEKAYNDHYHLANDQTYSWNELLETGAAALGVTDYTIVHVPSDTLVRYNKDWEAQLHGDKMWPLVFDNSKIKSVVGDYTCGVNLLEGMKRVAEQFPVAPDGFKPEEDALYDRIVQEQSELGV